MQPHLNRQDYRRRVAAGLVAANDGFNTTPNVATRRRRLQHHVHDCNTTSLRCKRAAKATKQRGLRFGALWQSAYSSTGSAARPRSRHTAAAPSPPAVHRKRFHAAHRAHRDRLRRHRLQRHRLRRNRYGVTAYGVTATTDSVCSPRPRNGSSPQRARQSRLRVQAAYYI